MPTNNVLSAIVLSIVLVACAAKQLSHRGDLGTIRDSEVLRNLIARPYAKPAVKRLKLATMLGTLDPDPENSDSDSDWYNTYFATAMRKSTLEQAKLRSTNHGRDVNGTTRHIKEIFLGRCWEYQYRRNIPKENEKNCDVLWYLFTKAFSFKGPCNVTSGDYLPFLKKADEDLPRDKALLWSGTRELAHKFSDFNYNRRFTTLEDTLAGYLVTGLTWCGSVKKPGMDFDSCPYECAIQAPYWALANERFAQKLKGVVHIILNGTRQHLDDRKVYPAYMKYRYYLGPYMVPHFNPTAITDVRIIVAHTLRLKALEKCNEDSVKQLQDDISKKGIPVTCYDDPDVSRHILCADDPTANECRYLWTKPEPTLVKGTTAVQGKQPQLMPVYYTQQQG